MFHIGLKKGKHEQISLFRFFNVIVLELYCFKRFGPQSELT